MRTQTILLTEQDVQSLVDWRTAVRVAEEVLSQQGKGNVLMPPKVLLSLRSEGVPSYSNAMPAYLKYLDVIGVKWGGGFEANLKTELPMMVILLIVADPQTGETYSIMSGTWITAAKTGCESSLAGKYLAQKGPLNVAVIGIGDQGRGSVMCWGALHALGDIEIKEMRLVDLIPERAEKVAKEAEKEYGNLNVKVFDKVQPAVEDAHAIVTCTTSREPIVRRAWIREGAFTASIGSFPEFEDQVGLDADKLVVDNWAQNWKRGEFRNLMEQGKVTRDDLYAELPDIVAGKVPGRESPNELIASSLIGIGSIDIAIAWEVYQRAKARSVGSTFSFL